MKSHVEKEPECVSYLIDTSTSQSKGHNFEYAQTFRKAYSTLKLINCYVTPDISASVNNDLSENLISTYISIEDQKSPMRASIQEIFKNMSEKETNHAHLFFLWGKQLNAKDIELLRKFCIESKKDLSINILSKFPATLNRVSRRYDRELENDFLRHFKNFPVPVHMYAWDRRENRKASPPILSLTEHFDYKHQKSEDFEIDEESHRKLSFFGNLTYDRGLGDFLIMALLNPRVKFSISGLGRVDRAFWRPEHFVSKYKTPFKWFVGLSFSILATSLTKLPNIKYEPDMFYEDHASLEEQVANSRNLYFATKNVGISSGIVHMALHFNIPTVWTFGNSPASDLLLEQYPTGLIGRMRYLPFYLEHHLKKIETMPKPFLGDVSEFFYQDILDMCNIHR